jgi:hypothetical protein
MQSPLRLIKRWRRYRKKGDWDWIPRQTRGVYVLYIEKPAPRKNSPKKTKTNRHYEAVYIGVAGVSPSGAGGVLGRLKTHAKQKANWTHFSIFEVHDNVSRDEILELESLLLIIFRHDPRIMTDLESNVVRGSKRFFEVQKQSIWNHSDNKVPKAK